MSTQPEPIIVPDLLEEADRHTDLLGAVNEMFSSRSDDAEDWIHWVNVKLGWSLCGLNDCERAVATGSGGTGRSDAICPVCDQLRKMRDDLAWTTHTTDAFIEGRL
ncbi:hypothetical protein [Gordonia alkaliphila]|uniref:HNH endonuclease n=1 Tax=Gordonia alkaliphila TaxID=1053547 RepID=A0ABP8Z4W4_9ACTN